MVISRYWKTTCISPIMKWPTELDYLRDLEHLLLQEIGKEEQFSKTWTSWSIFRCLSAFQDWIKEDIPSPPNQSWWSDPNFSFLFLPFLGWLFLPSLAVSHTSYRPTYPLFTSGLTQDLCWTNLLGLLPFLPLARWYEAVTTLLWCICLSLLESYRFSMYKT